jgi:hypothetical protein
MQLGSVDQWLMANRPHRGEQNEVYAFRFLINGLRESTEFNWLYALPRG